MSKYSLNKKTGKNYCDELWRILIRMEFDNMCPVCVQRGETSPEKGLNAHHLISRRVFKYRWNLDNGIILCPKHHEFDLEISAHTAPWAIEKWVKDNLPEQYLKWVENRQDLECEGKYKYEEIYHRLEKQYKAKTGEYHMIKRISTYLLSKDKSQIVLARKMQGKSISELATQYGVTDGQMKKFLET